MKKILLILSLLLCNVGVIAKTFQGLMISTQYEIDLEPSKTDVIGLAYSGDTLLVRTARPIFDFGESNEDKYYIYDLSFAS